MVPAWKQAMMRIDALYFSRNLGVGFGTPDAITLKHRSDGLLDRYKARFMIKGYTQTYGINYFETFSTVARMNSIKILFSVDVNLSWPLFQPDIKNAFLYGDLQEEVHMEQPPGYVAQEENKVRLKKDIYGLK